VFLNHKMLQIFFICFYFVGPHIEQRWRCFESFTFITFKSSGLFWGDSHPHPTRLQIELCSALVSLVFLHITVLCLSVQDWRKASNIKTYILYAIAIYPCNQWLPYHFP
jgi:hypothetical protein